MRKSCYKYTPPCEKISVAVLTELEQVQIRISNSGVEIPTEELPLIFDKFYRVRNGDRWKQGETGLGLALVKNLVKYLKGSIQVESRAMQTCFTINLPLNSAAYLKLC
ncbi:ATP-binding protein [Microcoleus sp. T3_B1]|uniref:ATP-binding protein n=1 Tax=Microcoleus sp. T3_B1 TaxID=3055425 RepID=UPI002FD1F229